MVKVYRVSNLEFYKNGDLKAIGFTQGHYGKGMTSEEIRHFRFGYEEPEECQSTSTDAQSVIR